MQDGDVAEHMGRQARQHVQERFSREAFGSKLNEIVMDLAGRARKKN